MKITIIIDANPIISSLLGGFSREILFNHHFQFVTTSFTLQEVTKYLPYIAKKSGVSIHFLESTLNLIPLTIINQNEYQNFIPKAKNLIKDPKDVDILALTLAFNSPLWSNDAHFEEIKEIKLLKTKDFI